MIINIKELLPVESSIVMHFKSYNLSKNTLAGITSAGYTQPTEIQHQVIPPALAGRDICAIAQTGSGKTASYVIPLIEFLQSSRRRARLPRCLVLVPTRELAIQVEQSFTLLGQEAQLTQAIIIGGESPVRQEQKLSSGIDIIIATPGRLIDHFERGNVILQSVQHVIIDEADRMLDMGFIPDIERLMQMLSKGAHRQTLFFSATMAPAIKDLVHTFLQDPFTVALEAKQQTARTILQRFIKNAGDPPEKYEVLRTLIKREKIPSAIVFCNRKADVDTLTRSLQKSKISAEALHGDLTQSQRIRTLESFRDGETKFLIASDIAARGIDIEDMPCVINFDLPINPEEYVHRIGRTGRAGREGRAYSFVDARHAKKLKKIETFLHEPLVFIDAAEQLQDDPFARIGLRKPSTVRNFSYPASLKTFGKDLPAFLIPMVPLRPKGDESEEIEEPAELEDFEDVTASVPQEKISKPKASRSRPKSQQAKETPVAPAPETPEAPKPEAEAEAKTEAEASPEPDVIPKKRATKAAAPKKPAKPRVKKAKPSAKEEESTDA